MFYSFSVIHALVGCWEVSAARSVLLQVCLLYKKYDLGLHVAYMSESPNVPVVIFLPCQGYYKNPENVMKSSESCKNSMAECQTRMFVLLSLH